MVAQPPRRHLARRLFAVLTGLGIDPVKFFGGIRGLRRYVRDIRAYRRRADPRFPFEIGNVYPILHDFGASAGTASGHYFHQDLWAATLIHDRRPDRHVDVGSRIDGFIAHLLTFMEVTVLDIRPLESDHRRLRFIQGDATTMSPFEGDSIESISCLHAVEHFGLGRYGDPIDPEASFTAMRALARVLKPGGRLYLSVPVGRERVEFNAHRIFDPLTVLEVLRELELVSFSGVDDFGRLHEKIEPESLREATYACGLFELTKPDA